MSNPRSDPVVEIRVHGVNGGSPEQMLGDPFPEQVAGDDTARFLRSRPTGNDPARVIEAFHWGRFTSGSPIRAIWLLLAPFAILNLAGFTLLPTKDQPWFGDRNKAGLRPRDPATWLVRALIRLLGLVLTLTLLLAVARTTMDVVMHQCAAAMACLDANRWLDPFGSASEGVRFMVGVVPPGAVIAMLWWFGRQNFLYEPPGKPADTEFTDTLGDRGFWHTGTWATPLRSAHVMVACAVLGALCVAYLQVERRGATPLPAAASTGLLWVFGVAAFIAIVVVVRPEPFVNTRTDGSRPPLARILAVLPWFPLGALVVAVALSTYSTANAGPLGPLDTTSPGRPPLPGFEFAARAAIATMAALLVLLVLGCLALRIRRSLPASLPRSFRPLWWGFAPAMLSALAVTLAGGFGGGLVFWAANLLGRVSSVDTNARPQPGARYEWPIQLGESYFTTGTVSGILVLVLVAVLPALVASILRTGPLTGWLLLLAGLAGGCAVLIGRHPTSWWLAGAAGVFTLVGGTCWWLAWRAEELRKLVGLDYAAPPQAPSPGATSPTSESDTIRKIATQWRLARSKYRYHWALGTVAALGGAGVVAAAIPCLVSAGTDVQPVGPILLAAVAAGFITLGLRSWGNQKLRVTVGVLWDLLAFWPRASHPMCPPPYGGRAVLELARRTTDIAKDPRNNTLVLSGHSQGSVVCLAAVAVIAVEDQEKNLHGDAEEFITQAAAETTLPKLALVTYGSQLQWAYARLFPRYVGFDIISRTYTTTLRSRWRNLHRWTDPLGGPVLTWPNDGTPAPAGLDEANPHWTSLATTQQAGSTEISPDQEDLFADNIDGDIRLRDPIRITTSPHTVRSPLQGHSDYFANSAAYDKVIQDMIDARATTMESTDT